MGERLTLSVAEAAAELGISARFVYDLAARGELASVRLGRRVLITRAGIERLLEGGAR